MVISKTKVLCFLVLSKEFLESFKKAIWDVFLFNWKEVSNIVCLLDVNWLILFSG